MWKPFLNVLAAEAGKALHMLDRFHITQHMNRAVDQVRRAQSTRAGLNFKVQRTLKLKPATITLDF
jgi:transposase